MRRKDDEKEKSIKEAVVKLILELGFHGTSISKIAKEAGVSPATVYIYYENKEIMFQDIYYEYSEEIFDYLLSMVYKNMDGHELIEILVRGYYTYIKENGEIFHFVDQFSSCPALACHCLDRKGIKNLNNLFEEMKQQRVLKDIQNDNLIAILFFPIKSIASNQCIGEVERDDLLKELITIIQDALLA
ncbi:MULTISPECIES: TetR/AcrR family transcriptional regulator [Clostridium]|uniref:TetR/AcrR family transcriptional regulator n=2 Tax=Clostridium TaxID=1485 RepID=A0AA47EKW5_9CLOT|nr:MULTISPECIES: TetR/AcrR family transcriptional regulator [Clostridium]MBU3100482.1 TetR/AcrR family transcriptional regulator [Clostridium sp. DSM 17811]MBU3154447.1 TetR/AcrR family transcriptional regulator [Clostridium estertheticum]MBU3202179.1 TetR/AcrR family transcriptional regulator [Clostridium estertheticum]MBX4263382.1 TetR/AcrR family transcriptional regulator [Clostridium estertheticum]MBX4270862.1 TetR/AcrR family transcriptional regulator [Clostridium estertheticum]